MAGYANDALTGGGPLEFLLQSGLRANGLRVTLLARTPESTDLMLLASGAILLSLCSPRTHVVARWTVVPQWCRQTTPRTGSRRLAAIYKW